MEGQQPKACETCERLEIFEGYERISKYRVWLGLPFIYSPIIFLPFILLSAWLVSLHLRMMGAKNLKRLRDFLPDPASHRYSYKSQIVSKRGTTGAYWIRTRLYWIFNCTMYCPFSVGALQWHTYLVKIVENWWCPFHHERKPFYGDAPIDHSYWHDPANVGQLHPDDRDNPIWNEDAGEPPPARKPPSSSK